MAIIRQRGSILHIQWYDPLERKIKSKSTGLDNSCSNIKRAKVFANKLQDELTVNNRKFRENGIKHITLDEAYQHFLRNNQDKSKKTIIDYNRFYKKFTEEFDGQLPCTVLTKLSAENWLNEIKKLPFAKNSIHGIGKQFIHFLNFLFEYNYTSVFKVNRDVKTKAEVKEKIVFNDEDITKIFAGLENKNSNFRTLVFLLFYTGLRPSDILSISAGNIDLSKRILKYYSPKRKKHREVPFHEDLVAVLRSRIDEIKDGQLIRYGRTEAIGRQFGIFFEKLGLSNKDYSARTFRKTFITLCRSRYNIDASIVRELVGHEHGNTTDKYYNEISLDVMKEALNKFKRPIIKDEKAGKN